MTKTKQNEDEQEEDDFTKFVSSAIRAPRGGAYEHLLSQFLASSVVVTDPLKRVKIVTEAAMMIPERERNNLAIDYDTVSVLNIVTNALLNGKVAAFKVNKFQSVEVVSIPWGFPETEENYKMFINPWFTCRPILWSDFIRDHVEEWKIWECYDCALKLAEAKLPIEYGKGPKLPFKCPRCGCVIKYKSSSSVYCREYTVRRIVRNPSWSFFFEATTCALARQGYDLLRNNFSAWAIPIVQQYLAELTRVVSPGLYGQILGLYTKRGKKSYADKVKEVSEGPTEDESGLG